VPLDLLGTSILNDRPALVSTETCPTVVTVGTNILCTQLGTFNTLPTAGESLIPVNNYVGPSQFTFNLRVSKTFGFGAPKEGAANPGGGSRPRGPFGPGGPGGRGGRGGGPNFGGGGASSGQRYSLTLSVQARNLFNIVNPSTPAGNLGSQRFDTSNALAGGAFGNSSAVRVIQLQAQFSF
jgi:hypothetical protein